MVSLILIFTASLFFTGLIIRTKSVCAGRMGPGILQPVRDVLKLFRKGSVYSSVCGPVFKIAPVVYFVSVLIAISVVPVGSWGSVFSFEGDFVLFAYILSLGKFFSILGALDTGSSFEGMGASRESLYSMLCEPAFFLVIGSLGLITGNTSFSDIFQAIHIDSTTTLSLAVLAAFVLLVTELVENSRLPIDDPKTHLELTMIHEVMILDNSGFDLGLILSAGYLKFAMYTTLIVDLFAGLMNEFIQIPFFFFIQIVSAVIIGIIESFMARFRMNHNPQFIFSLTSVALMIIFGVLILTGNV